MSIAGNAAPAVDLLRRVRPWLAPGPWLVALGAGVLGAAWLGLVMQARLDRLLYPGYDLAFFEQLAWNASHGGGLAAPGFFDGNFLGLHFSPLLLVVAQVQRLWAGASTLNWTHALAMGATAPAAFLVFRRLLEGRPAGQWFAAAVSAPLPFWPAMQEAAYAGFHTESLGIPLALLTAWTGLRGSSIWCRLLALVTLTAREDLSYALICVGLLIAAYGPRRRDGYVVALLGLGWGAVLELVVLPRLLAGTPTQIDYYSWLHHAHQQQIIHALTTPGGWQTFAVMLVCCAGLPLFRPDWGLLTLPPLAASLLSDHDPQPLLHLQYGLPLIVPLLVATGAGMRQLASITRWAAVPLALPALAMAVLWGPLSPVGLHVDPPRQPVAGDLAACAARLPPSAPVAADDSVAAPLAARPRLRLITAAQPSDWVMIDLGTIQPAYADHGIRDWEVSHMAAMGRHLRCAAGRFRLWSPAGA